MISPKHIGALVSRHTVEVEAGRLRFFAQATGQTDPRYVNAGTRRGDPSLPVPPTFLYCLDMDAPNPRALIELLDIDIGRVLHGEQSFTYHRMAYAGERLQFETRIADIYAKKNGALEFVVCDTHVSNVAGERVADLRSTIAVRNT
jgi:N-terminal half of MaoC dehydratase